MNAATQIQKYLAKRKTPATAALIAEKTGLNVKTVRNNLCPSGPLGNVKATKVSKTGPFTFGYSLA